MNPYAPTIDEPPPIQQALDLLVQVETMLDLNPRDSEGVAASRRHLRELVRSLHQAAREPSDRPLPDAITPRECDVLLLTAEGLRLKEIAARLGIGPRTVETHRAQLMRKLGCSSSSELTRYAIREGLAPI